MPRPRRAPSRALALLASLALMLGGLVAGGSAASAAADVVQPVAFGSPVDVTTTAAGQRVRLTFEARGGTTPTVVVGDSDFDVPLRLRLEGPRGPRGVTVTASAASYRELPRLDVTGRWTLVVDPAGSSGGTASLTLGFLVGAARPAALRARTTVRVGATGGMQVLTFPGTAGADVTADVLATTWQNPVNGGSFVFHKLVRPDGSVFGDLPGAEGVGWTEGRGPEGTDGTPLDVTGTWRLVVQPFLGTIGGSTFRLDVVPPRAGAPLRFGRSVTTAVATRGQTVRYPFAPTVGRRPTLTVPTSTWTGTTSAGAGAALVVLRPDGTPTGQLVGTGFGELPPVDAPGTWTLVVDPVGDSVGQVTFALGQVSDPPPATVTAGTPATVSLGAPGQNADLSFHAEAGQRMVAQVSSAAWTSALAGGTPGSGIAFPRLLRPDGSAVPLTGPGVRAGAELWESTFPLDATGTWTLQVDPDADSVGSLELVLSLPVDVTATLVSGQPSTLILGSVGQQAVLTLPVTAGTALDYRITGSTLAGGRVVLTDEFGGEERSADLPPGDSGQVLWARFGADGTHTITIDPAGAAVGSLTLTVTVYPDPFLNPPPGGGGGDT